MQSAEHEPKPVAVAPAPAATPTKIPMKMPMKMPMPTFAGKLAQAVPPPAAIGIKRAGAPVPSSPPAKRVRRSPSPTSSSSSSSGGSRSSSSSSSGSGSDSSSYSSSDSESIDEPLPVSSEPTLFDIAKSSGLINTAILEEDVEVTPDGPPPRPPVIRSFPSDIDKALERYRERLNREENAIRIKDDNKAVSLGTSKINYIDPRIVCSWAAEQNVPINKVFSTTIVKKFPWAMDTKGFDF